MKNYDLKMRERYEQKEYFPDKYGETRVDRMNNRKLEKYKKIMRKTIKESENNETFEFVTIKQTSNKEIFVHAYMKYSCENCGKQWRMYCERGIEEGGENHKPSPFCISCKCGGIARDVSGLVRLGNYYPITEKMSYFANKKDSDCGVPILR